MATSLINLYPLPPSPQGWLAPSCESDIALIYAASYALLVTCDQIWGRHGSRGCTMATSLINVWFQKISIPPMDGSLVFTPHPLGISLPEGHLWTPPTPQEFPFFLKGVFFKLTAFLGLNKSENSSFIFTQPLLIICCMH